MPFPFASHLPAMRRSVREIERADRISSVRAPDTWPDVQIEAWLDWADAERLPTDGDDPLQRALSAWARCHCRAEHEAEALAATMLLGLASPARSIEISGPVTILTDPDASDYLGAEVARRRAVRLAAGAIDAVARPWQVFGTPSRAARDRVPTAPIRSATRPWRVRLMPPGGRGPLTPTSIVQHRASGSMSSPRPSGRGRRCWCWPTGR
jgi:hypothetical protein